MTTELTERPSDKQCETAGCGSRVLPYSQPARCIEHIDNLDGWFESVVTAVSSPSFPESMRSVLYFSHDLYRMKVVEGNSIGAALYADYKNRVDPSDKVAFSFNDTVYFVLAAAASGVIGNFVYDVIKAAVTSLASNCDNEEVSECFSKVVRQTKYEQLRIEAHPDGACKIEVTSQIEIELETRYRLIVLKGDIEN